MNENQPPNEPNRGFFAGIRKSNLVRGDDRWLGGVSSAVVDRTGMDLTLVRGLFVVAGLFGIGFLAYGLAWLFLPDVRDGKIPAEEISDRKSTRLNSSHVAISYAVFCLKKKKKKYKYRQI